MDHKVQKLETATSWVAFVKHIGNKEKIKHGDGNIQREKTKKEGSPGRTVVASLWWLRKKGKQKVSQSNHFLAP
jgi:hypothetical protein